MASLGTIYARVSSLLVSEPFGYTLSQDPLSFSRQPTQSFDGTACVRVEAEFGTTIGGFGFTEDATDRVIVWVARRTDGNPTLAYSTLLTEASSITSAVIRDGAVGGGDYDVPDARSAQIGQASGAAYSMLRLTLPVRYAGAL